MFPIYRIIFIYFIVQSTEEVFVYNNKYYLFDKKNLVIYQTLFILLYYSSVNRDILYSK